MLIAFATSATTTSTLNAQDLGVSSVNQNPNSPTTTPIEIVDLPAFLASFSIDPFVRQNIGAQSDPLIYWSDPLVLGSKTTLYWPGISSNTIFEETGKDLYLVYIEPKRTTPPSGTLHLNFPGTFGNIGDPTNFSDLTIPTVPEPRLLTFFLIGCTWFVGKRPSHLRR